MAYQYKPPSSGSLFQPFFAFFLSVLHLSSIRLTTALTLVTVQLLLCQSQAIASSARHRADPATAAGNSALIHLAASPSCGPLLARPSALEFALQSHGLNLLPISSIASNSKTRPLRTCIIAYKGYRAPQSSSLIYLLMLRLVFSVTSSRLQAH